MYQIWISKTKVMKQPVKSPLNPNVMESLVEEMIQTNCLPMRIQRWFSKFWQMLINLIKMLRNCFVKWTNYGVSQRRAKGYSNHKYFRQKTQNCNMPFEINSIRLLLELFFIYLAIYRYSNNVNKKKTEKF